MKEAIREAALRLGFDQCGFASADPPETLDHLHEWVDKGYHGTMDYMRSNLPVRADPGLILEGVRSVVMVSLNYNQAPLPQVKIARYALGRDYHRVIRGKLRQLIAEMDSLLPGESHRAIVDSAPFLEREYANRAGLGWFGKNTMLINSQRGSWFFLGAILTTARIDPDSPAAGGCGTCRACIDACPTGAIVPAGSNWAVDARECISYLTIEHRGPQEKPTHGWAFGCDVCQEVCPFNQPRATQPLRATTTTEADFAAREWPSTAQLANLSEPEWDALTAGSAVRRAGFDGLRRNARLALDDAPSNQDTEPTD